MNGAKKIALRVLGGILGSAACFALVLLLAGKGRESARDLMLTNADNAKMFSVHRGERIVIRLGENPSTGYGWKVEEAGGPALSLVSSDFTPPPGAAGKLLGSGGTRVLTFRADQLGSAAIRLKLKRPWEPDQAVLERYSVNVQVRP